MCFCWRLSYCQNLRPSVANCTVSHNAVGTAANIFRSAPRIFRLKQQQGGLDGPDVLPQPHRLVLPAALQTFPAQMEYVILPACFGSINGIFLHRSAWKAIRENHMSGLCHLALFSAKQHLHRIPTS